MKILFVLFFLPALCFSQSKGDTKIIVKASDTANLFNRVVSYLYENGYSLERKDEAGGFLQTDEHSMKISGTYKVKALVKGGQITFSSLLNVPALDGKTFTEVSWAKGKSFYRMVWDVVDEIAKQFGSVSYGK